MRKSVYSLLLAATLFVSLFSFVLAEEDALGDFDLYSVWFSPVENEGHLSVSSNFTDTKSVYVNFYVNPGQISSTVYSRLVNIDPGTMDVVFPVSRSIQVIGLEGVVDPGRLITETNETNNSKFYLVPVSTPTESVTPDVSPTVSTPVPTSSTPVPTAAATNTPVTCTEGVLTNYEVIDGVFTINFGCVSEYHFYKDNTFIQDGVSSHFEVQLSTVNQGIEIVLHPHREPLRRYWPKSELVVATPVPTVNVPTAQPTNQPTDAPTAQPTNQPTYSLKVTDNKIVITGPEELKVHFYEWVFSESKFTFCQLGDSCQVVASNNANLIEVWVDPDDEMELKAYYRLSVLNGKIMGNYVFFPIVVR